MALLLNRYILLITVFFVGVIGYFLLSPCASNDATIINGTGYEIHVVMRVRGESVWAGKVEPSSVREISYMHPGSEGSFGVEVIGIKTESPMRAEFGYVEPYDGYGHVFLIDYQGIHHAPISRSSFWGTVRFVAANLFKPLTESISCAGPDWL